MILQLIFPNTGPEHPSQNQCELQQQQPCDRHTRINCKSSSRVQRKTKTRYSRNFGPQSAKAKKTTCCQQAQAEEDSGTTNEEAEMAAFTRARYEPHDHKGVARQV